MKPKSDLPQGTLDLLILKVVALGPIHGYAVAQRLEQVSRGVVRFRKARFIGIAPTRKPRPLKADWKLTETGREAKFYRVTRKGQGSWSWSRGLAAPYSSRQSILKMSGRCGMTLWHRLFHRRQHEEQLERNCATIWTYIPVI